MRRRSIFSSCSSSATTCMCSGDCMLVCLVLCNEAVLGIKCILPTLYEDELCACISLFDRELTLLSMDCPVDGGVQ